jgi:hypothetical protein
MSADTPAAPLTRAAMGIREGLPLEASGGGIEELRRDVQRLMDMEAIRQLKHAYFRCIDTANFEELAELIHDDVFVHLVGGSYEWKLQGKAAYLAEIRKSFHRHAVGHHNGHQPEIQMQGEGEATGIWYLADHMWVLDAKFYTTGTALYWDRYLKLGGRWKIRETRYRRIYEITYPIESAPPFGVRYLARHGSDPSDAGGRS